MARTTKRSFWSFVTRRRGDAPTPAPRRTPATDRARRLTLEWLDARVLPSVSYAADPANPGKAIVSFVDDTAGASDDLRLRLNNGRLEYRWNSATFSSDLDTGTAG